MKSYTEKEGAARGSKERRKNFEEGSSQRLSKDFFLNDCQYALIYE